VPRTDTSGGGSGGSTGGTGRRPEPVGNVSSPGVFDRSRRGKPPTPTADRGDARGSPASTRPSQTAISTNSGSTASFRLINVQPRRSPSDSPRTAVYGTVRTVVWGDRARKGPDLPDGSRCRGWVYPLPFVSCLMGKLGLPGRSSKPLKRASKWPGFRLRLRLRRDESPSATPWQLFFETWFRRKAGGGGGNRTHVRGTSIAGFSVCSRLKKSRPTVSQQATFRTASPKNLDHRLRA